jgi:nucleotide-binding universal stress UspA family protein
MVTSMRVVLAMDLRPGSAGTLRFARWLIDSGACVPEDVLAVHVVETDHLLAAVRPFGPGTLPERLAPLMREALDEVGLRVRAEVLEADNAEHALEEVTQRHAARMLLVGRRGSPSSFVRLGRVARRLLRTLPTAVTVVPPELRATGATGLGPGPILLASDLGSTDTRAVAFARELAESTGAGLDTVHVIPTPHTPHTAYDRVGLEPIPEHELLASRTDLLERWRTRHDLRDTESFVLRGELVETVLATAKRTGTPLIVCGSRQLSVGKRMFISSVSSSLCGLAECPVVTVGSDA